MLSEQITNKRADVIERYMETLMAKIEKADTLDENVVKLAECLGIFMAKSLDLETSRTLAEQLTNFMRKMESKGFNMDRLDD
jgi:chemotaxis regulatin CheY-phosphate phosphatase CheZ